MADGPGAWPLIPGQRNQALRLGQLLASGAGLWAECNQSGCGARAAIDAGPWLAQGLGDAPLMRLEPRLRCVCGARQARLRPGPAGATSRRGPIYPFS